MNNKPVLALSYDELQTIQNVMVEKIQDEVKKPDADFSIIAVWSEVTAKIDAQRRFQWNDEKFGVYEEIAAHVFASDDIPF